MSGLVAWVEDLSAHVVRGLGAGVCVVEVVCRSGSSGSCGRVPTLVAWVRVVDSWGRNLGLVGVSQLYRFSASFPY